MVSFCFHSSQSTVDFWTLGVWTVKVHLYKDFFFFNIRAIHDLQLVECEEVKSWIWKNHIYGGPTIIYTWIVNCRNNWWPKLHIVQGQMHCLLFLVTLSLILWLFRSMLLNFQICVCSLIIFCFLISLYSEDVVYMISTLE